MPTWCLHQAELFCSCCQATKHLINKRLANSFSLHDLLVDLVGSQCMFLHVLACSHPWACIVLGNAFCLSIEQHCVNYSQYKSKLGLFFYSFFSFSICILGLDIFLCQPGTHFAFIWTIYFSWLAIFVVEFQEKKPWKSKFYYRKKIQVIYL